MSADRRRRDKNEAAEGLTDLPPAASLLSVPIFRAAARQQAARRSAHRPASEPAPPSVPDADGRSTAAQVGLKAASAPATNAAPYTVVGGTDGGAQTQGEPPATRWTEGKAIRRCWRTGVPWRDRAGRRSKSWMRR
jgi:hypothetical protein